MRQARPSGDDDLKQAPGETHARGPDDDAGYPIACLVDTDKGLLPVHLCACGVFVIAGNNDHLDACPAQMRENAARRRRDA